MTNGKHPHPAHKPAGKKPVAKASRTLTAKKTSQKLLSRPKKTAQS